MTGAVLLLPFGRQGDGAASGGSLVNFWQGVSPPGLPVTPSPLCRIIALGTALPLALGLRVGLLGCGAA